MLYSCCDDRVIDIPTKMYFIIPDTELDRLCTEGSGARVSNPFYSSFCDTKGIKLTTEEREIEEEEEYEADESTILADLNIESDFWED